MGCATATEHRAAAFSYRGATVQLVVTIYGSTIRISITLAVVKSVVHTIGRMAAWLLSTMSVVVKTYFSLSLRLSIIPGSN